MSKIEHVELSRQVYRQIKKMILSRELEPGQKILQEKLADELGVSRTPLLKALQMLEYEMLVKSIPRRGMQVRELTMADMVDVFECRMVLEGLAAGLAAAKVTRDDITFFNELFSQFDQKQIDLKSYERADQKFHAALLKIAGNKILQRLEMIGNIHILAYQKGLLRSPEETLQEHFAVIDALAAGDENRAEAKMRYHLQRSLDKLKDRQDSPA